MVPEIPDLFLIFLIFFYKQFTNRVRNSMKLQNIHIILPSGCQIENK